MTDPESQAFSRRVLWSLIVLGACVPRLAAAPIPVDNVQRAEPVSFEKEILPLLRKNCLACHSASEKQGELVLESPAAILKGGDSGPAAIPGKGTESLLIRIASHQTEPAMPPPGNDVAAVNLSSSELGLIKLWVDQGAKGTGSIDSLSPKQWRAIPGRLQAVHAVAVTEDGQFVACSRANQIFLYHVPTGQLVKTLVDPSLPAADGSPGIAHRDLVQSLAFNVDGDLLASGGFREVKLWRQPRDVARLQLAASTPVTALAVSPDRQWIAMNGPNHSVQLWNALDGKPGPTLAGHAAPVTAIRFTPLGDLIVTGSLDQTVRYWNADDGAPLGRVETPAAVNAVELVSRDNPTEALPIPDQWLVTGGADNLLRVWNLHPRPAEKLAVSLPNLAQAVVSGDGRLLAQVDAAGTVRVAILESMEGQLAPRELATWTIDRGVTSLAIVPGPAPENPADEATLLTSSADGSMRRWSLSDKMLLGEWKAGVAGVRTLAVAADGKRAVSGAEDGTLALWDLNTPESVAWEGTSGTPVAITAMSPSRKLFALVGVSDGKPAIFVRNVENGQLVRTIVAHNAAIRSLAFSNDDARLVSGSEDQTIRVWDLRNADAPEIALLEGLSAAVTAVGTNNDGSQIVCGLADHALRMFNVADGSVLKEFPGHTGEIFACGFWNGQPFSVSRDNTVRFWNSADGAQTRAFNLPVATTAFALSADGQRMAFAGEDRQVRFVQTENGGVVQTLPAAAQPLIALSFSADGQRFAALGASGEVSVWSLAPTPRLLEIFGGSEWTSVAFAHEPGWLLSGDKAGTVSRRNLRFQRHFEGNQQPVTAALFHPNGQSVYTASLDGGFRGYNTENAQPVFATSHGAAIHDLALSPNEQVLATAGENGQVRLWQTNGGGFGPQQLQGFPGPVTRVAFSADNLQVVAAASGEQPATHVYDLQTGALLQKFTEHAGPCVGNVCLPLGTAPDSPQAVLTASVNGLWLWELSAMRQIAGHGQPITALAAIPGNPRQVFAGSLDATVRRWNLDNAQAVQQFNHSGAVTAIAVSPDAQRLAAASDNHAARLWNVNGQQLAELRGDVRLRTALLRRQQQQNAANARLNIAKQLLDTAEKDLPVKTEAEKKLSESLAAATKDVQDKTAALQTAQSDKIAAEKAAIQASAAAKTALSEKEQAERDAKTAAAGVQTAQAKVARLQQSSNTDPQNEALKQLLAAAQAELDASQKLSEQRTAALPAPTQKAQEMAALANTAAQKVTETQKPYNDALAALRTAEMTQNLMAQQQAVAARELKAAQELVPVRKDAVTRSEAAAAEAQTAVEAANQQVQAADLPLRSIAFSPDGSRLATAGDFSSLHTWDGLTGTPIAAFAGHSGPTTCVGFLDEATLVSGASDQSARVWELNPQWTLERTIGSADDPGSIAHRVTAVDFTADSSQVLVAGGIPSRSGELQVYRVADGERVLYLPRAHDDVVYAARFSPDRKRIVSGGADKYLRLFDVAQSSQVRRFEGHTSYVLGVAWKGDGQIIASSAADNTIKIWEAETGDQQRTIENIPKHVTAVRYIGETDNIVSACGDKLVRMHNASNGGLFRNLGGIAAWPHCVAVTPDANLVAAGDAQGNVYLWNGNNGQLLRTLAPPATVD